MAPEDSSAGSVQGLEDIAKFNMNEAEIEKLYEVQTECTLCWTTRQAWPVGMPHGYVWSGGKFWISMTAQRKRVLALRKRPQSCIVVSSTGTSLGLGQMVAAKTLAKVHDDRETVLWFLPLFLDRRGFLPEHREAQMKLFDTPGRIVIEFTPTQVMSWDARKLDAAMAASGQSSAAMQRSPGFGGQTA